MKHFIGGYEVSIGTKIAYERNRQRAIDDQLSAAEAVRRGTARPCRDGWNVVCHCPGPCEKNRRRDDD